MIRDYPYKMVLSHIQGFNGGHLGFKCIISFPTQDRPLHLVNLNSASTMHLILMLRCCIYGEIRLTSGVISFARFVMAAILDFRA